MPYLRPDFDETWSECLIWQYLGQVWIWVMSGQKLGNQVKSKEILVYTLEATFVTRFWWNFWYIYTVQISAHNVRCKCVASTCLEKVWAFFGHLNWRRTESVRATHGARTDNVLTTYVARRTSDHGIFEKGHAEAVRDALVDVRAVRGRTGHARHTYEW